MRWLPLLLLTSFSFGQKTDTISGFQSKLSGEELVYYSPYDRFAKTALLTRCNGNSPIEWNAAPFHGKQQFVTYELLVGHSTGTSSGSRDFKISLNNSEIGTLTTQARQKGSYSYSTGKKEKGFAQFVWMEYDANQDGFGKLYITVPAASVKQKAAFSILGVDANSRDWLMVFMYQRTFKVDVESTQLVTRKENKRQLNLYVDQPLSKSTTLHVKSTLFDTTFLVSHGYNKLSLPVYPVDFIGSDEIYCSLDGVEGGRKVLLEIEPLKSFEFHIIHHSHNDIGYSHLQTEVAEIQTKNIRTALKWIKDAKPTQRPYWHIESLWAVENFMKEASESEKLEFFSFVKNGNIVLSANYANILSGLSRPEELNWMLEYSKQLEQNNHIKVQCAMMTDIPGITSAGLQAYVQNKISYLSLGPNYVEAFPDHGDRVGGVIKEQGDKAFYWKPDRNSDQKVLVWTAGKGYSYFHNVGDKQKQERWEQKISDYCIELNEKKYPYDFVQLRYTKNADNGPVDTNICTFIDNWNSVYSTPKLVLSSVNVLFEEFEKRHGATLPVETGEISPYWEDGAFSTVAEEILNRTLSLKTSILEAKARKEGSYGANEKLFYALHRNILLFNEHTWGAWCSISDPEAYFTTEQWKIKKSFVDSAKVQYQGLEKIIGAANETVFTPGVLPLDDFKVDSKTGGISGLISSGKNLFGENKDIYSFEPLYSLGINPQTIQTPDAVQISTITDNASKKEVLVKMILGESLTLEMTYLLDKKERLLHVKYRVDKKLVKNKESLHIALPLSGETKDLLYGASANLLSFSKDQLAGSNREFICTDKEVLVKTTGPTFRIYSPQLNLFEVGGIINEELVNGVKVWKREPGDISSLFLYVFNNYWHTNYKAYQEGSFEFELILGVE